MEIKLGQKVRDKITGMAGIAVSRTTWLNGCVRVGVQPQRLKDGIPQDSQVFDEPQLEVVQEEQAEGPPEAEKDRHGPRPDATRAPNPTRR